MDRSLIIGDAGNKRKKRSKLRSAAIGLLSLARRDRLTPGNLLG